MSCQRQLPDFATAAWYRDPSDHRCPHDAWLEAIEISEPATGERKEKRQTAITIRLLGAYHDGEIIFRYSGVSSYVVASIASKDGIGDWLRDEFSVCDAGTLRHRITWCSGLATESSWEILAEGISYEWKTRQANKPPEAMAVKCPPSNPFQAPAMPHL